jgi:hypothetical protein
MLSEGTSGSDESKMEGEETHQIKGGDSVQTDLINFLPKGSYIGLARMGDHSLA